MAPVEIPLRAKYRRVSNSSQPSKKGGNSGAGKKVRFPVLKGEQEAARAVTAANKMVLLLIGGKHRRLVRADALDVV